MIERELLVGRRWWTKSSGHDSVHLLHQDLFPGTNRLQDGFLGQVVSPERGVEFSKDDRVFTELGFE